MDGLDHGVFYCGAQFIDWFSRGGISSGDLNQRTDIELSTPFNSNTTFINALCSLDDSNVDGLFSYADRTAASSSLLRSVMEFSEALILKWIASYFWPYCRISAMFMVMIVTGARFVSPRIRLYIGLAVTFAVLPAIPEPPADMSIFSVAGFLVTLEQLLLGVAMGMVTQFVIQTFVILGQILGMQSSLGFASMVDPANGQNTPLLGQLFMFLTTMFFLATDGHLQMIQLVVYSFESFPIGSGGLSSVDFQEMAYWLSLMFKMALNMALAGIIALLTVNLSFGVMTRAAPQLNIFSLGFSFALLVGLLICWYMLLGLYTHYELYWRQGEEQICRLIRLSC